MREGRDGGLIEFEVKGEQLRWKTEWSMEWGIEVGGELRRMTWTKGRTPAIVWESNQTSTLLHPRREFGEVSTASTLAPCSCLRRFSGKLCTQRLGAV